MRDPGRPGQGTRGAARRLATSSAEQTAAVGRELGRALAGGMVIGLSGELGSGKTTFVQGLFDGLGASEPVVSPSFVLIRELSGRVPLVHVDLYRLESEAEMEAIGVPDYLAGDGVAVVEWGERLGELAPAEWLVVRFEQGPGPDDRWLSLEPHGRVWDELLDRAWPAMARLASPGGEMGG